MVAPPFMDKPKKTGVKTQLRKSHFPTDSYDNLHSSPPSPYPIAVVLPLRDSWAVRNFQQRHSLCTAAATSSENDWHKGLGRAQFAPSKKSQQPCALSSMFFRDQLHPVALFFPRIQRLDSAAHAVRVPRPHQAMFHRATIAWTAAQADHCRTAAISRVCRADSWASVSE